MKRMEKGLGSILLQYHIDRREESGRGLGLSRSNALQVVTEALSSTTKLPPFCQIEVNRPTQEEEDEEDHHDQQDQLEQEPDPEDEVEPEDDEEIDHGYPTVTLQLPGSMGKTIVASDNDVTNGFVKDGKMLPYVFEANESGIRKKSSKILPVCGVCGKRFVCVTTMKRHLVTHTGEKPFSCKVCGKQYTQKGNLRVHERTHRNDRPFECNICHQKFYRKEPMQKHQWRQHGVVHSKSRPIPVNTGNNNNNNNSSNIRNGYSMAQTQATPVSSSNNDNLLYASLVDHMKSQQVSEPAAVTPNCYIRPLSEIVVAAASQSPLPSVAHLLSVPKPIAVLNPIPHVSEVLSDAVASSSSSSSEKMFQFSQTQLDDNESKISISSFAYQPVSGKSSSDDHHHHYLLEEEDDSPSSQTLQQKIPSDPSLAMDASQPHSSQKPIKLRMKFAYQKELEEQRQGLDDFEEDDCEGIPENLGDMKLRSSSASPSGMETSEARISSCDPLQCVGCCTVFAHKPALKSHQICPEDKERPFKCCKCGYKFRQKAHLQKHQWRIHRRRYCEEEEPNPGAIITLQDIINHGVEKSLQEIPIYHGKTSSKYYSEVLGLEYAGSDEAHSGRDVQPLDLSPVKKIDNEHQQPTPATISLIKIRELENNPLLSQPPLPKSPQPNDYSSATLLASSAPSTSTSINAAAAFPVWKKQRTEITNTTHRTLPPISTLQKPPNISLLSRKTDGSLYSSYKHSSWIRDNSNAVPTDLSTDKKSIKPEIFRNELSSRLQGQNGRTV